MATITTSGKVISRDEIEALRDEARNHGDQAMVDICERALRRDEEALDECARVIADARAQE